MNAIGHPLRPPAPRRATSILGVAALVLGACAVGGCTSRTSKPHPDDVSKLVRSAPPKAPPKFQPLPNAERRALASEVAEPYRIGRGDVLNIQGDQFKGFGETTKGYIAGTKVKPDGMLYLPDLAPIEAAGKTVIEVQDAIREAL